MSSLWWNMRSGSQAEIESICVGVMLPEREFDRPQRSRADSFAVRRKSELFCPELTRRELTSAGSRAPRYCAMLGKGTGEPSIRPRSIQSILSLSTLWPQARRRKRWRISILHRRRRLALPSSWSVRRNRSSRPRNPPSSRIFLSWSIFCELPRRARG